MAHRAFTLVELLVVIIVIGVLTSLMIIEAGAVINKSEAVRCCNDRKILTNQYLMKKANSTGTPWSVIMAELATEHNAAYSGTVISGICPKDNDYNIIVDAVDDRKIKIVCANPEHNIAGKSDGEHIPSWVSGADYVVGDTIEADGIIFKCIRDHTSGSRAAVRNPSVGSNKSTWEAVGTVGGNIPEYTSTIRYGKGFKVVYNGVVYIRKDYMLNTGQSPFNGSPFWSVVM